MKSHLVRGARQDESQVEIHLYMRLMAAMLQDVADLINTYTAKEASRDFREIESRVAKEGLAFLTKTLPSFAKAVDTALASDTRLTIPGFKTRKGVLPHFMYGVTSQVFDCSGRERSDASPDAVRLIRQVGYCFYKLRLPFDENKVHEKLKDFVDIDAKLDFIPDKLSAGASWVLRQAKNTIFRILAGVDPLEGITFRHGPGATATGEKGTRKGEFKRFYPSVARVFPYDSTFFYNLTHFSDRLQEYLLLEEHRCPTAKVVMVPKDSRGPRLISMEPLEIQWVQQGLKANLEQAIVKHPLTRGFVNFTDQSINRDLALSASRDAVWATLDMKDASDRVSCGLVKALFPSNWVEALFAARSTHTLLPNGTLVELKKFAPMGSAVCFPVESLIFWALASATVAYRRQNRPNLQMLIEESLKDSPWAKEEDGHVYVYGDDIICRSEDYAAIMQILPEFGLMFNKGKCCTGSSFRESCGMDAFKGVCVTPVRIQARWSSSLRGMEYPSFVSYACSFWERGYVRTGNVLEEEIQRVRPTPYTDKVDGCGAIAFHASHKLARQMNASLKLKTRFNPKLQRKEALVWRACPRVMTDTTADGWNEMQRIAALRGLHPEGLKESIVLLPRQRPYELMLDQFVDSLTEVRAYQYTLPRQVVLRRGWTEL